MAKLFVIITFTGCIEASNGIAFFASENPKLYCRVRII